MTKIELDERIAQLEAKGGDDAVVRIKRLRDFYQQQQAQQAAHAAEQQQKAEAAMKQRARDTFMRNPVATAEAFERAWPQMKERILIDEAIKGETAARARQSAVLREIF